MRACPRCGHQNPEGTAACGACGIVLEPLARPAPAGGLKQTMLGLAPPGTSPARPPTAPAAPAAAPEPARVAHAGTMIGLQSPFAPQPSRQQPAPAQPEPAPGGSLKRTMLGFAPPAGAGAPEGAPTTPPVMTPAAMTPPMITPPVEGNLGGTLAYNPPDATAEAGPATAPSPVAPPSPGAAPPDARRIAHAQTMLGVARPGIAPLQPGKAVKAFVATPATAPAEAPRMPPGAIPSSATLTFAHPGPPKRSGLPRGALVLMGVAAALAITAGVVAFLWESPRPMRAEVALDDRGNEALALTCDDCVDGTVVSQGPNKATFKGKKAQLALGKPLEIGDNRQVVSVHRPGIGRDEEVVLNVAMNYRVRGVLTSLDEDPPLVKVEVQATPGSTAVVDGRPVSLDATGKGEYSLDVSKDLEGPADTIQPFEKKLPYVVTPSGGEPKNGEVTLRFGIVPLRVEAPGESIVVDGETFMLSGRTLKDGRITVSGRPITVDAQGRFAQLMNVSSVGETTVVVRAEAKDHAPRFVRCRVKRVKSLRDEATTFRQSAVSSYGTIVADPKVGEAVVLDGDVMEARLDGEVTVLLLEIKKGCAQQPCLARVVYGGRFETKKGAPVSAYGLARGNVDGPRTGRRIPEVAAEFLLGSKR